MDLENGVVFTISGLERVEVGTGRNVVADAVE